MAFVSGTASFQRFGITGKFATVPDDTFFQALQKRAFGRGPAAVDDAQAGWVGTHLFDTVLDPQRLAFGRFVHLGLRIDRLRAPSAVIRGYVRQEEDAQREATGRAFLSRGERRQAREKARLRVEQEQNEGRFRRHSLYPVLIDLEQRCVYFGALGTASGDRLMVLFSETFGCAIETIGVERLALRMSRAGGGRKLEGMAPLRLVDPPDGLDAASLDPVGDLSFLGREFLAWLWYETERQERPLRIRRGDELTVAIDRTLRLRCAFGLTGTAALSSDAPTRLPEALAALRSGKQPARAGLVLGGPTGEFRLALDAQRWNVSGLQAPEGGEERDPRARIEQRFEQIADAAVMLDALFEVFFALRCGENGETLARSLRAWAGGRTEATARRGA